jgi:hypothetical protein
VVYAKPPFGGPAVVLKYLSRYTHRVAITNQRLVSIGGGLVRLRYHDYADHNAAKILTLSAEEFLRRFLLHVLPLGFKRIRHFGRLASRGRAAKLQRCRHLLGQHPSAALSAPPDPATKPAALEDPAAGTTTPRCPICGSQRRRIIERRPPIRPGPLLL